MERRKKNDADLVTPESDCFDKYFGDHQEDGVHYRTYGKLAEFVQQVYNCCPTTKRLSICDVHDDVT